MNIYSNADWKRRSSEILYSLYALTYCKIEYKTHLDTNDGDGTKNDSCGIKDKALSNIFNISF